MQFLEKVLKIYGVEEKNPLKTHKFERYDL
jgi:hypothetical protein